MEIGVVAAFTQGGFYFLTGIWPIINIGTFQKITGPRMMKGIDINPLLKRRGCEAYAVGTLGHDPRSEFQREFVPDHICDILFSKT